MVQTAPRGNTQQSEDPESRLQDAIRIVDELPTAMLPRLVSHVMNTISQQLEANQLPRNGGNGIITSHEVENAIDDDEDQMSGYDLVIAGGGPMTEVAKLLRRGNLTDKAQQQIKKMAVEAWLAMPPDELQNITDEEIEQIRDERRISKYGR